MLNRTSLIFAVVIAAGIFVYWLAAGSQAGSQAETRVSPPRKSKAFQYLESARNWPKRDSGGAGAGNKVADGEKKRANVELIYRLRDTGAAFLREQDGYLHELEDREAHNEAIQVLTLGNRLMLAAVLKEMSQSSEYAPQLTNMLQDEAFRWWVTDTMSEYFPELSQCARKDGKIEAGSVAALFSGDRDFLAEFDLYVSTRVSPEYAAEFETGVANFFAGTVLAWQAVADGEMEKKSAGPFLWERLYEAREGR